MSCPRGPAVEPADATSQTVYHYSLAAAADPSVLPRALALLAKRGLLPLSVRAETQVRAGEPGRLTLEMSANGLEPMAANHVAACLRQIWGVDAVLMHAVAGESDPRTAVVALAGPG